MLVAQPEEFLSDVIKVLSSRNRVLALVDAERKARKEPQTPCPLREMRHPDPSMS